MKAKEHTFVSLWKITSPLREITTITYNWTVTLCLPIICTTRQQGCVAMVCTLPKVARRCNKVSSLVSTPIKMVRHAIISLVPATILQ